MENKEQKPSFAKKFSEAFSRGVTRKAIYLKNHLTVVPLFFTVLSTIIITCTIFIFNYAIEAMPYRNINGFCFFVTIMASVLSSVSYLMATGKHVTKKKKILMLCIYYALMVLQVVLNIIYYLDVLHEISLNPSFGSDPTRWYISLSAIWSIIHVIFIVISVVLSILAPLLQPRFKKIKVNKKTQYAEANVQAQSIAEVVEEKAEDTK